MEPGQSSDVSLPTSRTAPRHSTSASVSKSASGPGSNLTTSVAPIHSFEEADDYIFDVRWHPAHPAVFGTVDGSGKFNLWNLNSDTEVSFHPISPS